MSALLASAVLADEAKKSGPIGLAVILLLCVACYFLFKSMSKHLRRARDHFPADERPQRPQRPQRPDQSGRSETSPRPPAAEVRRRDVDLDKRPPDEPHS